MSATTQDRATYAAALRAPFAVLGVHTTRGAVSGVEYLPQDTEEVDARDAVAAQAVRQLTRYLEDPEFTFDLPLDPQGSAFRRRVWEAIAAIPVGESRTYAEIARTVHTAARAVGGACGANPIALIIPCHRVVGSRGALGGFMHRAAGDAIDIKRWLLGHEGYRFGRA